MAEEPEKKADEAPKDEVIDAAALDKGKETAENKLTGDESIEDQLKSGGDDGLETRHISPVDFLAYNAGKAGKPVIGIDRRPFIQRLVGHFNIWLLLFFLTLVLAGGTVVVMYALNKKEQNITINTTVPPANTSVRKNNNSQMLKWPTSRWMNGRRSIPMTGLPALPAL